MMTAAARPVVAHRILLSSLNSPFSRPFDGLCQLRFVGRITGRATALGVANQTFHRRLADPVPDRDWDGVHLNYETLDALPSPNGFSAPR